jgi:hypothetical protein
MGRQFMTDFDKGMECAPPERPRKNRVDTLVANLMLRYPTIFPDRFKALEHILTTSDYAWDEHGCLVNAYPDSEPERTPEVARAEFLERIEEREKEAAKYSDLCPEHLLQARDDLRWYDFISENIEVASARYLYRADSYACIHSFLARYDRYCHINKYSPIMNKPEVVDQEWSDAIREWLREIIPPMNGVWGHLDRNERGPWMPSLRLNRSQLIVWELVYYLHALYKTDADRKREAVSKQIVAEMLAEQEAKA